MKESLIKCIFTYDNNCEILVPEEGFFYKDMNYCEIFMKRVNHEVNFRKIVNLLIKEKIIQGNIIDLGSWIGDNSIPWSKNINSTVYAIDPSPENCNFINKLSVSPYTICVFLYVASKKFFACNILSRPPHVVQAAICGL